MKLVCNEKKKMCEKEKMLVSSIFSFSHNVFKSFLFRGDQKYGLHGEELRINEVVSNTISLKGVQIYPKGDQVYKSY